MKKGIRGACLVPTFQPLFLSVYLSMVIHRPLPSNTSSSSRIPDATRRSLQAFQRRSSATTLAHPDELHNNMPFFFCSFSFILRRMGKNKALAHHTSTYLQNYLWKIRVPQEQSGRSADFLSRLPQPATEHGRSGSNRLTATR